MIVTKYIYIHAGLLWLEGYKGKNCFFFLTELFYYDIITITMVAPLYRTLYKTV